MKVTAVRLIKDKDPVGVFGGWMSDSSLDLNLIRECMNPPECEFLETDISAEMFGIIWPKARQDGEDLPAEMKFSLGLNLYILEIFTVWEKFSEQKSEESLAKQIEDMQNSEISYLKSVIFERDEMMDNFMKNNNTSIMFMFGSWVVAAISIALLILK